MVMKQTDMSKGKLAVVLVRGLVKVTYPIKETIALLNLKRKNCCVVMENNVMNKGMIIKVKDYVTWGEISSDTFQKLLEVRGKEFKKRETDLKSKYEYNSLEVNGRKYKKYFCLNPPRKGFGRKGIKIAFKVGGALGYRGEKINDLIIRML